MTSVLGTPVYVFRFIPTPLMTSWFILFLIKLSVALSVDGIQVHKVPLNRQDDSSPWCFAASVPASLDRGVNFLATQVWPSARVAATAVQMHLNPAWRVCEFGCGPGLPSIAAAKAGADQVFATDLDEFLFENGSVSSSRAESKFNDTAIDLVSQENNPLPEADLYILSDVFESSAVARGAAMHTICALEMHRRVWAFAQSDRAQRQRYIDELRQKYDSTLSWTSINEYNQEDNLWLCEVDETAVSYC